MEGQWLIKGRMMELNNEIDYLNDENMTDQKFWGMLALDQEDDEEFDYGRDVLKENNYDQVMVLPYENVPLFNKSEWQTNPS